MVGAGGSVGEMGVERWGIKKKSRVMKRTLARRLEDQETMKEKMAQDLGDAANAGIAKDETKGEIDKDIKDAKAEKDKLQEMASFESPERSI